jgi:hypothetical protein
LICFLSFPCFAEANASYGVQFALFPGFVFGLGMLYTVLFEAVIIKLMLQTKAMKSVTTSIAVNIFSMVVGFISFGVVALIFQDDGLYRQHLIVLNDDVTFNNIFTFWITFLVCYFVSIHTERLVMQWINKTAEKKKVRKTSYFMNSLTYGALFVYFGISGIGTAPDEETLTLFKTIDYLIQYW